MEAGENGPLFFVKIFDIIRGRGQKRFGSTPNRGNKMPLAFAAPWRQGFYSINIEVHFLYFVEQGSDQ